MVLGTGMEFSNKMMEQFIKEIGEMVYKMDMEPLHGLMAISMRDRLKIVFLLEKENSHVLTKEFLRENSNLTRKPVTCLAKIQTGL